jgi:hypothetical protein
LGSGGLTGGFSLGTLGTSTTGGGSYRSGGGGSNSYGSSSFLGSYYVNPFSMGMPGTNNAPATSSSFGQALYNSSGTAGGRGGRGGTTYGTTGVGNITRGTSTSTNTGSNFSGVSTIGVRRAPQYTTGLAQDIPMAAAPPPRMQVEVQQVLGNSSRLPSRGSVQVTMDGSVVVLTGSVADEREKRLAEAMARMTPGVREVRNELVPRENGTATASGQ